MRKQALVDELAAASLPPSRYLPGNTDCQLPPWNRAVDAELEELAAGVVLDVVVVHLHELEPLAIVEEAIAVVLVLAAAQPAEPDALAR